MRRIRSTVALSGLVVMMTATTATAATITDDNGSHRLFGTRDADTINAAGGHDRVFAYGGDDTFPGGTG